jgi:NAD-dependent SIR2 family protein deacetylase
MSTQKSVFKRGAAMEQPAVKKPAVYPRPPFLAAKPSTPSLPARFRKGLGQKMRTPSRPSSESEEEEAEDESKAESEEEEEEEEEEEAGPVPAEELDDAELEDEEEECSGPEPVGETMDDVHRYEQLDAREVYEPPKMETYTIPRLARDILSGEIHNIIVMTGAGISTAAGVPDYTGKPLLKLALTPSSERGGDSKSPGAPTDAAAAKATEGAVQVIRSYAPDHPVVQVLETAWTGRLQRVEYKTDGVCWVYGTGRDAVAVLHQDGAFTESLTRRPLKTVPEYVRAFIFDTDFVKNPDPLVKVHKAKDAPAAERRRKVAEKKERDQWSESEHSHPMPELDDLPDEELHTIFELVQHKFRLATPGAWMSSGFLQKHPAVFYQIVRRLRLNERQPTLAHHFIAFLHHKNRLQRHYTQNLDGLHRKTTRMGFQDCMQLQREACGTLVKNYCECCQSSLPEREYAEHVREGTRPTCVSCKQQFQSGDWQGTSLRALPESAGDVPIVRPEVVLDGEDVPQSVMHHVVSDFQLCDLVIVIGSSLTAQPFARWLDTVPTDTPRLLINKEPVHEVKSFLESTERRLLVEGLAKCKDPERKTLIRQLIAQKAKAYRTTGFDFKGAPHRDVFLHTSADVGVLHLLDALQWREEFAAFVGPVAPCSALSRRTLAGWKPYLKGPAPPRSFVAASVSRKRKADDAATRQVDGRGPAGPAAGAGASSRREQPPSKKSKVPMRQPKPTTLAPPKLAYSQELPTASLQLTLKATAPNGEYSNMSARELIMQDIARERRRDTSAVAEGREFNEGKKKKKKKRAALMSFLATPPPPPNPTMLKRRLTASSNSIMRAAPRHVGRDYEDEDEDEDEDDEDPEDW